MNMQTLLDFLTDLRQNNSADWMREHRDRYLAARAEFEALVAQLTAEIAAFDPTVAAAPVERMVYRLNRDLRFSQDKSPYNPTFRAHIAGDGRAPIPPGYYLQLSPGGSFLGGGANVAASRGAVDRIRQAIVADPVRWQALVELPQFHTRFAIGGVRLKAPPRGVDKDHPAIEWLKHKSWTVETPLADELLLDPARCILEIVALCREIAPLNRFFLDALEGFTPECKT